MVCVLLRESLQSLYMVTLPSLHLHGMCHMRERTCQCLPLLGDCQGVSMPHCFIPIIGLMRCTSCGCPLHPPGIAWPPVSPSWCRLPL
jgi:hypothetical protein